MGSDFRPAWPHGLPVPLTNPASVLVYAFFFRIVPTRPASDSVMFLRGTAVARAAAARPPSGVIGFLASLKERLATGKLLRPDVADDVLRLPMEQSKYRTPAPG